MTSPDASIAESGPDSLLRHRGFPLIWTSRVFAALGFQAASVAIGWRVYELTGSAYDLGLVGLFQFLPMVVLTFVVGHVADRFDRRRIVTICQSVEALTMLFIALGTVGGWLGVHGIFAAVVVLGGARSFEGPTISALIPAVVPAALLPRAMAVSSSAMQTATIIGPSAGGLLYAFGPHVPFFVATLCFVVAAVTAWRIPVERPSAAGKPPVTLKSVFAGVGFIRNRPVILGTISLDLFAVLLGGVTSLLPIFAQDILHTGPWGLGLLRSAPAVGAVLMSLVLARKQIGSHVGLKMFTAVAVFGLATIVFAASSNLIVSCLSLVVLGAADNVSVVIRSSLVLLSTPDEMRGRVNAVNSLFIGTSNQLGEFESGMLAGLMGAVPAGILSGIATLGVVALWMAIFPALRRAKTFADAAPTRNA